MKLDENFTKSTFGSSITCPFLLLFEIFFSSKYSLFVLYNICNGLIVHVFQLNLTFCDQVGKL